MDSKLRGRAILVSLSAVLLIALLVVYGNMDPGRDNSIPSGTSQEGAGQDGQGAATQDSASDQDIDRKSTRLNSSH